MFFFQASRGGGEAEHPGGKAKRGEAQGEGEEGGAREGSPQVGLIFSHHSIIIIIIFNHHYFLITIRRMKEAEERRAEAERRSIDRGVKNLSSPRSRLTPLVPLPPFTYAFACVCHVW